MPSTFAVARAGAVLGARRRSRASSVLETVIAAVPAKPASRPLPMLAGQRVQRAHAITSWVVTAPADDAPSRSSRWSPTRSAFAIAVSAGFTALDDGKKLVSTT